MNPVRIVQQGLVVATAILLLAGCAVHTSAPSRPGELYYSVPGDDLIARHAPIIVHENDRLGFNRPGRAVVEPDGFGGSVVRIDATAPSVYTDERRFEIEGRRYTNLIYRMHFPSVPVRYRPAFNVTAGRNGGLVFIVTLNADDQPVLLTTVQSCGCYLAIVPTGSLAVDSLPPGWPDGEQTVYGETLPARLALGDHDRFMITLRDQTHRVMAVTAFSEAGPGVGSDVPLRRFTLRQLESLPYGEAHQSFYETDGAAAGWVRDAYKPFESWLLSWWTFDRFIGRDKQLGAGVDEGPVFYTSLKPWARKQSDLRDFTGFLRYWGWRL